MAKVKSAGLRNYVGRLGGNVYYMNKGQNIGRELAPSVSNPRTKAQMRQRMMWANLVNTYKANKGWMGRLSFEAKPETWSFYNAFMSANLYRSTPIYLTKDLASTGGVILAPYVMTQGTLPKITLGYNTGTQDFTSSIKIAQSVLGGTVGAFSADLLAKNPAWAKGDQLSFISMFHTPTYIPVVDAVELIIDPDDTTPLSSVKTKYANLEDILDTDGDYLAVNLGMGQTSQQYALCLVHSRTQGGKTYVSPQEFVLSDYATIAAQQAGTDEAFEYAYESYGTTEEYFLSTPEIAETLQQRVRAVNYDGVAYTAYRPIQWSAGTAPHTLIVSMTRVVVGSASLNVGGVTLTPQIIGNQLHASISAAQATSITEAPEGQQRIVITIGSEVIDWT